MKDSLENSGQIKRKRKRGWIVFLTLTAFVLLALIVGGVIWLMEKQDDILQKEENTQNAGHSSDSNSSQKTETSLLDILKQDKTEEVEWVIEGDPVSIDSLYGYYLPEHCSDTEIANEDVILNMFEEKEWSTCLSPTGKILELSAVPLLWNGSKVYLELVLSENLDALSDKTGYPHGLAGKSSYEKMIRKLFPKYGFTTVTYYDSRANLYTVDCAYTVDGNDMTLLMIHYEQDTQEYSLIPMEQYQVIREDNVITIYKDKNFVSYVPYNLCENASLFQIEAFCSNRKERYEDIKGITYYNQDPKAETWPLHGCVYFSDGTKAPEAEFDFSKENQLTIRWDNKVTDYFGTIVELEGSGEVTFSYQIVQDTRLILKKDGVEYFYLQNIEE